MPFLDAHRTPGDVLDAVESGALSPEVAFGEDPGWRDFSWAVAAGHAGREALRRERLESLSAFAEQVDPDDACVTDSPGPFRSAAMRPRTVA